MTLLTYSAMSDTKPVHPIGNVAKKFNQLWAGKVHVHSAGLWTKLNVSKKWYLESEKGAVDRMLLAFGVHYSCVSLQVHIFYYKIHNDQDW